MTDRRWRRVVALSGGVGGARLVNGLDRALDGGALTTLVNTGDDFVHWGLNVSPDLDTVMYTLADLSHVERGWGLADETFNALDRVKAYGGDAWFALGDRDLATHLLRTEALRRGERLTDVTARLSRALGVRSRLLPMSDAPLCTIIETAAHGALPFQRWFVEHRAPAVKSVRFEGDAPATPEVLAALAEAELVVIGPSNPYVSIDPITTRPGVREALARKPIVAVSPISHGQAIKGPLAEMLRDVGGAAPSPGAIVQHYAGLVRGIVVEPGDEASVEGAATLATNTLMTTRADSLRLAREVLRFAEAFA